MKALLLDVESRTAKAGNVQQPQPAPGEILVKVEAVSLNPVDPLYVGRPLGRTGRIIGCDFAGLVISVGEEGSFDCKVKIGDRVAGFVQGACSVNDRPGAFAEYMAIPHDLVWNVDDRISLEQACGVSLCALTAAQVLWYRLGLPAPFEYDGQTALKEHPNFPVALDENLDVINIYIHSASTVIGLYVAQFAQVNRKTNGTKVKLFGSASKVRWSKLKTEPYLYDHLVDYHDEDWPEQIKELSGGVGMHYVFDTISEDSSISRCISILGPDGKAMAVSRTPQDHNIVSPVPMIYGAAFEGLGEEVQYDFGETLPRSASSRDFASRFYRWLSYALGSKVEPVTIRLMPGGLEKIVEDGFRLLGAGKMEDRDTTRTEEWMKPISAEKLVYRI